MKASKTQKHLKEIPYSSKKFLKTKENNITPAKTNVPLSETSSECGEEQEKYLQSSQNKATYHPMNPDTDVKYPDSQFV